MKHAFGLFATIVTAVLTIWTGPLATADTATKIAQSAFVALALAFTPERLVQIRHQFLGLATLAGAVLSFAALKIPASHAGAALVPLALAVLTDLTKLFQNDGTGGASYNRPAAFVILAFALWPSVSRADTNDPRLGRCLTHAADGVTCQISEHFSAVVPAVVLDLKTGDALAGAGAASLGICHGLTYAPAQWWASGADLCVVARVGSSAPNQFGAALMFFVADYGAAGIGTLGTQGPGGLDWHGMIYLAPRLPVQ